jgi:hypothetical protein
VAIDLQRGSALHHGVQGAERFVVAGEVEARYLPGNDPQIQHYGPDVVKRTRDQLFSPVQNLETRPFQIIRCSGKVPLTVGVRRRAEGVVELFQEGSASTKCPRKAPKSQPSKRIWSACRINRS